MTLIVSPDKATLATKLCNLLVSQSVEAVDARGVFVIAISGGSIPKMLSFANLTAAFTTASVEMNLSKWVVFLADERIVAADNADSNLLALRRDGFLGGVDGVEERCKCYGIEGFGEKSPPEIAQAYEDALRSVLPSSGGSFDTVVLGMGEDGHTCSLFPGHDLVKSPKPGKMVDFITDSPKPPPERITLTMEVLNSSRHAIFAAAGAGKAGVLGEIFEKDGKEYKFRESTTTYPCEMVRSEGDLVWLVDEGAAS
eukprot:CAMPEP_0118662682 /NCGR_PEP_ID=MMETSP0785-20121206/16967_1 /TAXON_ID=91992 /ORGANISM="Bolidomonas pacifica, Strain CCMP 1866" /LENGTH=254 /DNA_ID=CAMNT_0006556253 /DNA_START=122 /DNA_END=883 /DNA_ORIENTATION=-